MAKKPTKAEAEAKRVDEALTKMRKGEPLYCVDKPELPALIEELMKDEVMLITGTSTEKVTVRLGVATYTH